MIKRLEVYNALGIKEKIIEPGQITLIKGKNGSGKTSILEAIEKAIFNNERRAKFIRSGEDEAVLLVEFDDGMRIERKIGATSSVKVEDGEGVRVSKPETFLKSLVGGFAFNPVDFLQEKPQAQTDLLLSTIPISVSREQVEQWFGEIPEGIDYSRHGVKVVKALEAHYYEKRHAVNAELKKMESERETLRKQLPPDYDPEQWKDGTLKEIYDKISKAKDINHHIQRADEFLNSAEEKKALIRKNAEEKIKMIQEQMNLELREVEHNETMARQYLAENTVQDIEPLETLAETTEKMKALLPLANNAARIADEIEQAANKQRFYDSAVQFARTLPQTLLESVDCPIEGLGIDQNGEITINGLPIKNLSTSQQIKLSLEIAKVTSGAMKLICIDRFESLDSEMQKEFLTQMEGDGFQYFITQVTDGELTVSGVEKE
jgi:energy-coupling factor transporter ATP-binding protein EcfA2